MSIRDTRRAATLDRIADHMLSHGLAPSSLRALAAASGTSDRMLLYYFADKDDIVVSALQTICVRLAGQLFAAMGDDAQTSPAQLVQQLAPILRGEVFRPFMQLWLELAVLASRGIDPFVAAAGQIADYFIIWVASRLALTDERAREAEAAGIVALLDGLVLLDCVGRALRSDSVLRNRLEHGAEAPP